MAEGTSISRRAVVLGTLGALGLAGGGYLVGRSLATSSVKRVRLPRARGAGRRAPNVLLVVTDQERARHLIPSGLPLPQRDRLMEGSTVFHNAHAATNLCSMSRGNLYTGRHAQNNGVWENTPLPMAGDLRRDVPTLGHLMQDAGYTTGYFGKWHLTSMGSTHHPGRDAMRDLFQGYGFQESDQDGERDGTWYGWRYDPESARNALAFVERHRGGDAPWFAAVNFVNPHDIMFFMTGEHQRRTRLIDFPDAIRPAPDDPLYATDWKLGLGESFGPATLAGKPAAQREYQKVMELALGEIPFDREDLWAAYRNYYWNCLRDVDRQLGVLLDGLERLGQADRTVVIYTADHGEMAGTHGLREKSGVPYREVSNVPLWIRHPDVEGGRESRALTSMVDVLPTALALAGVDADALHQEHPGLVGRDLSPALDGSGPDALDAAGRQHVLFQWTSLVHLSEELARYFAAVRMAEGPVETAQAAAGGPPDLTPYRGHMRGLYDGRFKFARYFSPRQYHRPETWEDLVAHNDLELYDTLADPRENHNLATDPASQRERIEALNRALLALVDREVGDDDGSFLPGPTAMWQLG
jgi:arylsulfatase